MIGPELVLETADKVVLIKEKLKAGRYHQKSYVDFRRKPLESEVGDCVLSNVSPWKGVVRFGKKGKLAPRYVGPFEILERIGLVAYRLRLPEELNSVHDTFHVSNLKKCLGNANLNVPLNEIKIDKTLRFVEEPVKIMDREIKSLKLACRDLEAAFEHSENPTIYVSLIKQFWETATARTLDNGRVELTATIDGKVKIVTEASVRRHLQLADSDSISSLPTTEIFEQLSLMGNMKRASKGYTGENIPLFLAMIVQGPVVQGEGSTHPGNGSGGSPRRQDTILRDRPTQTRINGFLYNIVKESRELGDKAGGDVTVIEGIEVHVGIVALECMGFRLKWAAG
ncbi:hypothetical protein Tco_1578411 [Tanacetum coccineum]